MSGSLNASCPASCSSLRVRLFLDIAVRNQNINHGKTYLPRWSMVELIFGQPTSWGKTNSILGSSSIFNQLLASISSEWIAPPKIRSNDMFKSMFCQEKSLPNRFSLCPIFLISKKSFKITKNFRIIWN